ncbi:hypothetical protein V6N12_066015 [Hibiscus sabdariffa]|uniref:Reverse transcriptase zinc-binding domain-containing protein n=1 Tax=Hibiscus sabdariffa TaxID=183260 RepID=A0ABR2ASU2_9ROSI
MEAGICVFPKNCLRWGKSSTGCYSVKEFCQLTLNVGTPDVVWENVWERLAPSNVECFVWRLLHGLLPSKLELSKRGISQISDLRCAFCLQEVESTDHVFFGCSFAWSIWCKWYKIWDVQCARPVEGKNFFNSWSSICPMVRVLPLWKMAFFAISWSLWICRNELIFREWNKKVELIIETDCETAVFWINNPNTTPFAFKDLVNECLSIGTNLSWKLYWNRREGNVKADRLAKAGIEPGLMAAR